MLRNIKKVEEMFNAADQIIRDRPEILSLDVDTIFDELDDGTREMRSIRWGVMTRAKMKEIESLENNCLIDFMLTVNEWDLLREYIGYVLQSEHDICLINLLIDANKKGVVNEIFPFIIPCLEYEKSCLIDKLEDLLSIISVIDGAWKRNQFVRKYAILIVEQNQETIIFEKFLSIYSSELEQLVSKVSCELFTKRYADAKSWLDTFIREKSQYCQLMSIDFLYSSLFYNLDTFEEFFEKVENEFCGQELFWKRLIPVYVKYLEYNNATKCKSEVKNRLLNVKNEGIEERKICVQAIEYLVSKSQDYADIMDSILSVTFDKDNQILDGIDFYLKELFDRESCGTLERLYELYEKNRYTRGEKFLDVLSQTCVAMSKKQDEIFKIWWNKFLYGTVSDFNLSVEIFSKIFSLENIDEFFKNIEPTKEELLSFLEGICLFTIEDRKIAKLTFIIASHIKDRDFFYKHCLDNIYINYAGVLLEASEQYIECDDEFKTDLARTLKDYYVLTRERIELGYKDKDFTPSTDRQLIYHKHKVAENRKINKMAEEKALFSSLFPSRKMKYGKRFAYIQTLQRGEKNYNVSEYVQHSISAELPKYYINNPIEYINMRLEYLDRRRNNEANN